MRTAAILPLKGPQGAKSRLAPLLGPAQRASLARAMAADVVGAIGGCAAISRLIVVGANPRLASAKLELLEESGRRGQSAAAEAGIARALALGFERVVCLPGDLPALDPRELDLLLAPTAKPQLVIVPDRHGEGTNCLVLSPPDLIKPSFGPGSLARHLEQALERKLPHTVARPPTLLLDIDSPDDLRQLVSNRALLGTRRHTRRWLHAHRLGAQARA